MAILRSLSVSLKANIKDFTKGMKKARKVLRKFSKGIPILNQGILKLSAAFTALAAGGLGLLIARSLKAIDTIGKLSDIMGITTSDLQAFRLGAELAGASIAEADKSMQIFTRRLGEASNGVGEARTALKQLNLSAQDLIKMPTADALATVADAINQLPTAAEQAAAAFSFFGRQGVSLANFIKGGSAAMKEARKDAKRLGLEFNRIDAAVIEEVNDNLLRMRRLFDGIINKLTIKLGPAFLSMSKNALESLIGVTDNVDSLKISMDTLLKPVDLVVRAFAIMAIVIESARIVVGTMIMGMFAFAIPLAGAAVAVDFLTSAWASLATILSGGSISDVKKIFEDTIQRAKTGAKVLMAFQEEVVNTMADSASNISDMAELASKGLDGLSGKFASTVQKLKDDSAIANEATSKLVLGKALDETVKRIKQFNAVLDQAKKNAAEGLIPIDRVTELASKFEDVSASAAALFVFEDLDKGNQKLREAVGLMQQLSSLVQDTSPSQFQSFINLFNKGLDIAKVKAEQLFMQVQKNMNGIIDGMLEAAKSGLEKVNEKIGFALKNQALIVARVGAEGFKKILRNLKQEAKDLLPQGGGGSANLLTRGLSLEALKGENKNVPQKVVDPQLKITNQLLVRIAQAVKAPLSSVTTE